MTKRIQNALAATICLLLFTSGVSAGGDSDRILGTYWLPEKDGKLEVYETGGRFFGRITAYDVVGQTDEKNPDKKLRDRPIIGVNLLTNFAYDIDSDRWMDGTIYDAKSGKTYKCRVWFEDGDKSVLWARGFIGFSLLGRTEKFERVVASEN
jgi:uncharacterized protein (DUF2147 family)